MLCVTKFKEHCYGIAEQIILQQYFLKSCLYRIASFNAGNKYSVICAHSVNAKGWNVSIFGEHLK